MIKTVSNYFCPRSKLVTTLDQQQTSLSYKFKAVKLDFET